MSNYLQPARLLCLWISLGKNANVGCHSLLRWIFLTQGLDFGLLHYRQILYQLSYQVSPLNTELHINNPSPSLEPICLWANILSIQFSSVTQSCPTLCNSMNHRTPGLPVHHQLPEFTQTHVYQVSDAIRPSHPLSSPSPPAPHPYQHQSFFQWVNSLHEMAKVLKFQLQHQSFQWTPRTDLL